MASSLVTFGNDLYTGKRSVPFVAKRRIWYTIAIALVAVCIAFPLLTGGFNFGIEFRGGSQFQIAQQSESAVSADEAVEVATEAVATVVPDQVPRVTTTGGGGVRVQTEVLDDEESNQVSAALVSAFDVPDGDVSYSLVGPSWGADITAQAIRALVVFIIVAAVLMAIYFRTWKMSLAAMISVFHDIIITAGVYAAVGFEVTPGAVIGLLTILGFSLYDTVVVFDKIRENTAELGPDSRSTFGEAVNLGVNQTLVRSINTAVVAVLPVAAILFIGSFVLGADTLRDISLALFVGTIAGTYSTVFIAAPLYAQLRENEPAIKANDKRAIAARQRTTAAV